ncbi:NAD(P)-binding protein [Thozetella sp. PMI_491]|nr:NAD(P)-binding protein [Thozetella sp. PMI_491]
MSSESPFPSFTKIWHTKSYSQISPSRPELSAAGKFVVVSGGGIGIGLAISVAYAQAGAKTVAILGRRRDILEAAAEQIRAANPKGTTTVLFETADVSDSNSVTAAVGSFAQKTGTKIDILVSNAGILPNMTPVLASKELDIREGLNINILGPLNLLLAAMPYAAPNACIFNISSGIGHMPAIPGGTWAYAATKMAVIKMFDYLQFENPDLHIVSIHPGVVASAMNTKHGQIAPMDEPELPGNFLVWLASTEAKFLKNRYVWVNWDVEELVSRATEIESSSLLQVKLDGVTF